MWLFRLRKLVRTAGREALILYFAIRDPETPWPMKAAATAALGYLFSPLDLLPDLPLLGWVDDLLVVSVGLPLLIRRLPPEVLARASAQAERVLEALGVPTPQAARSPAARSPAARRPRAQARPAKTSPAKTPRRRPAKPES